MPANNLQLTANFKTVNASLVYEKIKGKSILKNVYYYFPVNHKGIVYLFHGANGSTATWTGNQENKSLINDLIAEGFAVVITESEEVTLNTDINGDGSLRWEASTLDSNLNIDFANLKAITDTFYNRGYTNRTVNRFTLGQSNGGSFSISFAHVFKLKSAIAFCASGGASGGAVNITTTPTMFCLAGADNNSTMGLQGNANAISNSQAISNRGVCSKYHLNYPSPLYQYRFARNSIISSSLSIQIFNEIKNNNFLNSKNYFIGYIQSLWNAVSATPQNFPIISALSSAKKDVVEEQIRCATADHQYYSEFNKGVIQFYNYQCQPVLHSSTVINCDSYTWPIDGQTYTTSGSFTSVIGCHTEILNLTIKSSTHNVTTQTACDSYVWNGTTYTTSGTYVYSYTNANNCPSADTLKLTIKQSTHNVTTQTACDSYIWNGTAYRTSGTYVYSYTNGNNCPSADTLKLTIKQSTHNITTQTACDSYVWNGTSYTTSGTYVYSYTNANNCPSADTLKLTIKQSTHNVTTQTACDSYTWNGTAYTTSGTYVYAYTNANSCPSMDTLKLTIKSSTHNVTTQTACDSYTWNGTSYTISGTYVYAYTNGNSCPSADTLKLTIVQNSTPITTNSAGRCSIGSLTLSANTLNGDSVLWYQSQNSDSVIGRGNSFTTPVLNSTTTYFVRALSSFGCYSQFQPVIATIASNPLTPTGNGLTICAGSVSRLSVTVGAGETADWYTASTNGVLIKSNSTLLDTTLSTTKTFYAAAKNIVVGCISTTRKAIIVTVNTIPANVTSVVSATRCGADTATIKATATTGNTIDWYTDSLRTTAPLQSGAATGVNSYSSGIIINNTTTYWAVQRLVLTGCLSAISKAVTVIINQVPDLPTVTDYARCGNGSIKLSATASATPSGNTIAWYANPTITSTLSTTATYTTPTTSSLTTTYYVASKSTSGCYSNRKAVVASINAIPAAPSTYGDSTCAARTTGQSVSLTVSAVGDDNNYIKWYASTTATAALDSINNSLTRSLTATTTYYAADYNPVTRCISSRVTALAKVLALPAAVTTSTNAAKCGTDTASIKATATAGNTINWYADSLRTGSPLSSGSVPGVNTYALTTPISATTTYFAAQRVIQNGCLSAASRAVVVVINAVPSAPAANDVARCGTGTVVLAATLPTSPAGTVIWYSAATGGTQLGTAATQTTTSITAPATLTYYVAAVTTATKCTSTVRRAVVATANEIPGLPSSTTPASICGPGVASVAATTTVNGGVIDWYSAATAGTLLRRGSNNLDSSITATRTFFAGTRVTATGCASTTRSAVAATVNTLLAASATLTATVTNICPIVNTSNTSRFTAKSVTGATSYVWTIPTTAVIDSPAAPLAANGLSIKIRFTGAGANDSVYVQAIGAGGCAGAKKVLKLTTTNCVTPVFANIIYNSSKAIKRKETFVLNNFNKKNTRR